MELLPGQVAVVTGAASGIGRALAGRLGALGLDVVLADVEEAELARTAAELAPGGRFGGDTAGGRALPVPTDVSDPDQVERLAGRALDAFGAVDVVCNNAGVSLRSRPSWRATADDWRWVLGVNLLGVANGVRSPTWSTSPRSPGSPPRRSSGRTARASTRSSP
jgi:NAD(P)-dependent dehydrogenase (short-subunit alcohol dehydrogenase family)